MTKTHVLLEQLPEENIVKVLKLKGIDTKNLNKKQLINILIVITIKESGDSIRRRANIRRLLGKL